MQNTIIDRRPSLPSQLCALLPSRLREEIEVTLPVGALIEEVRLRRGHAASLTVAGENLRLQTVLGGKELDALLLAMCEGSLYAHSETICRGYLTLRGGIRVGVCGRAGMLDDKINGVLEPSALVLRIPHPSPPIGGEIAALLQKTAFCGGVLLFSPPGVGKTTVLRGVAATLASDPNPYRVAVVDTRGELGFALEDPTLLVDVLSGYPRGKGISIAARTLSAQVIVCDEIGDLREAQEILEAHSCGVPLITTAHADSVGELLSRPGMRQLHQAACFGAYVRLRRTKIPFSFDFEVTDREAANAFL